MKRLIVCIFAILVLQMLFAGCDRYLYVRPDNYPNTRWVSENPDMYFEVGRGPIADVTYAQIIIDGEVIEMKVGFDVSNARVIYVSDPSYYDVEPELTGGVYSGSDPLFSQYQIFRGLYKFRPDPDRLIVYDIQRDREGFLDDSIEEIVFIRENIKQFRKGHLTW